MNHRALAARLRLFIDKQTNIAGLWDGKTPGASEDAAHQANDLIELAQPLLDKLQMIIAKEDHVSPGY
jgi:hypothetical protein